MIKRQVFIKTLLKKVSLSQAWLARKLNLTPQNLSYHLNESPELDADLYVSMLLIIQPFTYGMLDDEEKQTINEAITSRANLNPTSVKEPGEKYKAEGIITKEDLELLHKLKSYGIDSIDKLESFYDYAEIVKDLDAIAKARIERLLRSQE